MTVPEPVRDDAFISYAREDSAFVHRLREALVARGKKLWVDLEDIPPSADWRARVMAGIEGARTFVFVLSPASAQSKVCGEELGHALELKKRLIPVVAGDVDSGSLRAELRAPNWILFQDANAFEASVESLVGALEVDFAWLDAHARYSVLAGDWLGRNRDSSLLLRGGDLRQAEAWLAQSASQKEAATEVQVGFILASRQAAARRRRLLLGGVLVALVASIGFGVVAVLQWRDAVAQRREAIAQRKEAVAQRKEADRQRKNAIAQRQRAQAGERIARSEALAAQARDQLGNDAEQALAGLGLARDAVRVAPTREARTALRQALESSRIRARLRTTTGASIADAAISPPDQLVATAGRDGYVRLWGSNTGGKALRAVLRPPGRPCPLIRPCPLLGVRFGPDGSFLAAWDKSRAWIWNVSTRRQSGQFEVAPVDGLTPVVFSSNPRSALVARKDGTALLYDPVTTRESRLDSDSGPLIALGMSKDGARALVARRGGFRIWSTRPRTQLAAFAVRNARGFELGPSGDVVLWRRAGSREVSVWKEKITSPVSFIVGAGKPVSAARFASRDSVVTSAGRIVQLWRVRIRSGAAVLRSGFSLPGPQCTASPDGRLIAAGGTVWDSDTKRILVRVAGNCIRFSEDGTLLVTHGSDAPVVVDTASRILKIPARATSAAPSPDGRVVAVASSAGVQLWSVRRRRFLPGPALRLDDVDVGGRSLLDFGGRGRYLLVLDSDQAWIWPLRSGGKLRRLGRAHGVAGWTSAASSPTGNLVATVSGSVRLWDARTGRHLGTLPGPVEAVAFSPDGKYLATADGTPGTPSTFEAVKVWDVSGRRPHLVESLVVRSGRKPGPRITLSFSPDGASVLVTSAAGKARRSLVRVWSWREHRSWSLEPNGAEVLAGAFSPDGRFIAIARGTGAHGAVDVWNVATHEHVTQLTTTGQPDVNAVEFVGGSLRLLAVSRSGGIVRFFDCEVCRPVLSLMRTANARLRAAPAVVAP